MYRSGRVGRLPAILLCVLFSSSWSHIFYIWQGWSCGDEMVSCRSDVGVVLVSMHFVEYDAAHFVRWRG